MKRIVTMIMAALLAATCFATEVDSIALQPAKPKRFSFGVAAGLVKTRPSALVKKLPDGKLELMYPFEGNYGFDFGGIVRFRLSRFFHLESGLSLNNSRFSVKNYFAGVEQSPVDRFETTGIKINTVALRIPLKFCLQLRWSKTVRLFWAFGLQESVGLQARAHTSYRQPDGTSWSVTNNLYDKELTFHFDRFYKNLDLSWTMGVRWRKFELSCEWISDKGQGLYSGRDKANISQTIYSLSYIF